MPTLYKQSYENWEKILKAYFDIGLITNQTTFICHSSSPAFLVKFVINNKIKIKKLISVSGANNFVSGFDELDKVNSSFFISDVSDFKNYCAERVCIYSDNDKYIPFKKLTEFADSIDAKHVLIKGGGHLNLEVGYLTLPQILDYI